MSEALSPTQSLRRRAAVAVFSGLLDESDLLQALWLQHDQMRGDAVSDIIRFVDAVAQRHGLDAATCRRLYNEYYKSLRLPDAQLPLDPWSAMQVLRPAAPAPVPNPIPPRAVAAPLPPPSPPPAAALATPASAPAVLINPVAAAMAAASRAPVPAASTGAVVATGAAAAAGAFDQEPIGVFAAVMRAMIDEVQRYHREALDELRKDALALLPRAQVSTPVQATSTQAWSRPLQHDWRIQGSVGDLAQLLRIAYQALAEAFGRVGADQILQRALKVAESTPEARLFSPRRLMAAM